MLSAKMSSVQKAQADMLGTQAMFVQTLAALGAACPSCCCGFYNTPSSDLLASHSAVTQSWLCSYWVGSVCENEVSMQRHMHDVV